MKCNSNKYLLVVLLLLLSFSNNVVNGFDLGAIFGIFCRIPALKLLMKQCKNINTDGNTKTEKIKTVQGGTVRVANVGTVKFVPNTFQHDTTVTITKINNGKVNDDDMLQTKINNDISIYQPIAKLSYNIQIKTNNPPFPRIMEIQIDIPERFMRLISQGSTTIEIFTGLQQGSTSENSFILYESITKDCNITTTDSSNTATCKLPGNAFIPTNNNNEYKAIITMAHTPGVITRNIDRNRRSLQQQQQYNNNNNNNECLAGEKQLYCPLEICHIQDSYRKQSYHPVYGFIPEHLAVDYKAEQGTNVLAAASGVVESVEILDDLGGTIIIKHEGIIGITRYSPLATFNVNVGDIVQGKQSIIGLVGGEPNTPNSGTVSKKSHLHLEYIPDAVSTGIKQRIDPHACMKTDDDDSTVDITPTIAPTFSPATTRVYVENFYISFATQGTVEPTPIQYKEMVERIETYFRQQLAGISTGLGGINLSMSDTKFNAGIPEDRYNIYIGIESIEFTFLPGFDPQTKDELFNQVRNIITEEFLMNIVRTYENTPFALATEVNIGEPGTGSGGDNGGNNMISVNSDPFYIAYVAPGIDRSPDVIEINEMIKRTEYWLQEKLITSTPGLHNIELIYNNRTIYDGGIPEERFNILIEFEKAIFTYLPNAPNIIYNGEELIQLIQNNDYVDYILQVVRQYEGTPWVNTNEVLVQRIEVPVLPTISPKPTISIQPSLAPSTTSSPTLPSISVTVNDFYIAYVAPGANNNNNNIEEPTIDQYNEMVQRTERWLREKLKLVGFVDIKLNLHDTKFQVGIPDERFNIYMEYESAILQLSPNSPTPIGPDVAFDRIRDAIDAEYILLVVREYDGSPWVDTNEVIVQRVMDDNMPSSLPFPSSSNTPAPTSTFGPIASVPPSIDSTGPSPPVQVNDLYIAYAAPMADREPTFDEYNEMVQRTQKWLRDKLIEKGFIDIELFLRQTKFAGGVPEDRFNIYIEFDKVLLHQSPESSQVSPNEAFEIIQSLDLEDYKINIVREFEGTPWVSTNDVIVDRLQIDVLPTPAPTATFGPSASDQPSYHGGGGGGPPLIEVNKFYISYVSPTADREPSPEEYNEMVIRTVNWMREQLLDAGFIDINLTLGETKFGAGIPEERFNIYLEFDKVMVQLSPDAPLISPEEAFQKIQGLDYVPYIMDVVRLFEGSPWVSTMETILQRLDEPTLAPSMTFEPSSSDRPSSDGESSQSSVEVRNFFIAYASPTADREPSTEEINEMVERTTTWMKEQLLDDGFIDIELNLRETKFEAGIPEDRFNIYLEFEKATLQLAPDSPPVTREEAFEKIRNVDLLAYIMQIVNVFDASPWVGTQEVIIRRVDGPTPPPGDSRSVDVDAFYIAYASPSAAIAPNTEEYADMVQRTVDFMREQLLGVGFADIELFLSDTKFDAGIPEDRFNIYLEFEKATLQLSPESPPVSPEGAFERIQNIDVVAYLMDVVNTFDGSPWVGTQEVIIRRVDGMESSSSPFGSSFSSAPNGSSISSAPFSLSDTTAPSGPSVSTSPFGSSETPFGSSVSTSPFGSTVSTSPTSSASPVPTPTLGSNESNQPFSDVQAVQVPEVFIAFVAPDANIQPNLEEYNGMISRTEGWLKDQIAQEGFVEVDFTLRETQYQAGIPEERFNIYMEFESVVLQISPNSDPVSPERAFEIIQNVDWVNYIMNVARGYEGSPWVSTNEVIFNRVLN